jgi:hypothetical protein
MPSMPRTPIAMYSDNEPFASNVLISTTADKDQPNLAKSPEFSLDMEIISDF